MPVTLWDRDPLLVKVARHSTGAAHEILIPPPITPGQVWTAEIVSVYLQEVIENTTPNSYWVVYGVYNGKDYTWFHTRNIRSGHWIRVYWNCATFLTEYRPAIDVLDYPANLAIAMNAVGYIRAPFTSP